MPILESKPEVHLCDLIIFITDYSTYKDKPRIATNAYPSFPVLVIPRSWLLSSSVVSISDRHVCPLLHSGYW